MAEAPKKKVAKVAASATAKSDAPVFTPTPESKAKATKLRVIAVILWVLAIGAELATIFWILRMDPINMWLLIGALIVIGVLALAGGLIWKKSNRYDPASRADKVRFFVQNQLGAIITAIAFIPLIIMILFNKNMDGKQKGIAAGIAAVLVLAVGMATADWNPPSQEQYANESNIIVELTGQDEVFWVKGGKVFHVCDAVPDVNKESKDNTIYNGTVAAAHEAGKDRLTSRWASEAINYCGYTQEQVDAVQAKIDSVNSGNVSNEPSGDGNGDSDGDAPSGDGQDEPGSGDTSDTPVSNKDE